MIRVDLDSAPDAYISLHDSLDETVSDGLLDAREREIRTRLRELVAVDVAPRAGEVDRDHLFAHESFQAIAAAGLAGLTFPEHLGGTGDSHVAYAVAMEEIAAACPSTSLIYMTQMHAAYPIFHGGSDELARRWIPAILDGSRYGSIAITEPNAGSDVSSLSTRARPVIESGRIVAYRVSGSKTFITTGDRAGVVACFATIDPALGRHGVTALVIDGEAEGFASGPPFEKMGMHGSGTAELFLSDVLVPAGDLIGEPGSGWELVMASVVKSRVSAAAQGVGIARAAYGRALLALREIHGRRLPDEIGSALADLRGDILRGRLLLWATAREIDRTDTASAGNIAMMKQVCTDLGWRTALAAVDLLGPYGDLGGLGVERYLRDARVGQIYDGTNEIQRLLIARDTARTQGVAG